MVSTVLGQVWYLNVSIPDLCLLPYFVHASKCKKTAAGANIVWSTLQVLSNKNSQHGPQNLNTGMFQFRKKVETYYH